MRLLFREGGVVCQVLSTLWFPIHSCTMFLSAVVLDYIQKYTCLDNKNVFLGIRERIFHLGYFMLSQAVSLIDFCKFVKILEDSKTCHLSKPILSWVGGIMQFCFKMWPPRFLCFHIKPCFTWGVWNFGMASWRIISLFVYIFGKVDLRDTTWSNLKLSNPPNDPEWKTLGIRQPI